MHNSVPLLSRKNKPQNQKIHMSTTTTTLTLSEILRTQGPRAAERQMDIIAHRAGDNELTKLISDMDPSEVATVIVEGDFTKTSIASHLISPDLFLNALERLGANWKNVRQEGLTSLRFTKNQIEDFVLSVTLGGNPARRQEMINAMLRHSLARRVIMILPLYEECKEDDYFLSVLNQLDSRQVEHGTWQELYVEIESVDSDAFVLLRNELRALVDENNRTPEEKPMFRFFRGVFIELQKNAKKHASKNPVEATKKPNWVAI